MSFDTVLLHRLLAQTLAGMAGKTQNDGVKLRLTPSPGFNQRRSKKEPFVPREAISQSALFDWAKWARSKYPDLDLMFSVPNGMPLGDSSTRYATINWMKSQGMKAGVPDINLPVARGGYFGLWLEMKVRGGTLSEAQHWWASALTRAGACVMVCESFEQAVAELERYLGLPKTEVKHGRPFDSA